jgi:hypothetical protein
MIRKDAVRVGGRAFDVNDLGLGAVTVRVATAQDARALDRLAQLDSARPPAGPTLVAEVDAELVAAVPILGGRPVADPFRPTAQLVTLLELRAAHLTGADRPRRRFGSVFSRPLSTPAAGPRYG